MIVIKRPIQYAQIWLNDPTRSSVGVEFGSEGIAVGCNAEGLRIGCLNHADGETSIRIFGELDINPEVPSELPPRAPEFICELSTPSRRIEIKDSEENFIFELSVDHIKTRVSVWMNHPVEPEEITIRLQ